MAKKQFDAQAATSKFFSNTDGADNAQNTDNTQSTDNTHKKPYKQDTYITDFAGKHPDGVAFPRKQGRPKKSLEERKKRIRYNLLLDFDLNQYLHEIVWQRRTSMTDYVNDLIRADYEAYLKDCKEKGKNPFEGWEKPDEA